MWLFRIGKVYHYNNRYYKVLHCNMNDISTSNDVKTTESYEPLVYYRGEDGYIVREMMKEDIHIVVKWYNDTMGAISKYDIECALNAWPRDSGFVVGVKKGKVISSAIRIECGKGVFYGGLYYVSPEERRKGYGNIIRDKVAGKFVGDNILAIEADVKLVEPNRRQGYTGPHFKMIRYEGKAKVENLIEISTHIKQATIDNINAIISYDNQCYVTADFPLRREFLKQWIDIPGGNAVTYVKENGDVIGFACRRPTARQETHIIGPLYADNKDIAKELISALCQDIIGKIICLHISDQHPEANEIAEELGLKEEFHCMRMYLNGTVSHNKKVFAVTSIDVAGF